MTNPAKVAIDRIQLAMKITGMNATPLAKEAGVAGTTFSRLLSGSANSAPSTRTMMKLDDAVARFVGSGKATNEQIALYENEYKRGASVVTTSQPQTDVAPAEIPRSYMSDFQTDSRSIPVLGTAAGSALGAFEIGTEAIDFIRRPPSLAGSKEVYAIYVVGESMIPQHKPGELRIIHPKRPAVPGDSVVIQTYNASTDTREAFIKELVRDKGREVVCRQHNPPMEITYLRPNGDPAMNDTNNTYVIRIHKVLTMNDLHGF